MRRRFHAEARSSCSRQGHGARARVCLLHLGGSPGTDGRAASLVRIRIEVARLGGEPISGTLSGAHPASARHRLSFFSRTFLGCAEARHVTETTYFNSETV